jgi:hypothetical protein
MLSQQSKKNGIKGHAARMEQMNNAQASISVGKSDENRPRWRFEDWY